MDVYPNVNCKEFDVYPDNVLGELAASEYVVNN